MDGNRRKLRNLLLYIGIPVAVLFIIVVLFNNRRPQQATYKYSDILNYFEEQQVAGYQLNLGTGEMVLTLDDERGTLIPFVLPSVDLFYMDVSDDIDAYNQAHPEDKMVQDIIRPAETSWIISLLPTLILFGGLIFFWVFMMKRLGAGMGGGDKTMSFGKAKIKQMSDEKRKTTFADVAGADEEKEELREIVEFLKNPSKYNTLGARIPKGVLLVGPPGTGKTLLARAVAGEAGVPFFSISGSDFVEMFVGVGASRVRDLFDKAKKNHPCIIFIDEIDAVGRQRGAGLGGGHDEREQTLNQLLVEMDGFAANEGVIVMAATNRVDILDPALLRPGRFDRQVYVGLPDIRGREAILKVHSRNKPLGEDVDLSVIAKATSGFTGADLENLMNEASLLAARRGERFLTMSDLHEAMLKVIAGPEKKSRVVTPRARKLTAFHEAGHAIVIHELETPDPVHQITIIPRGPAGGMTISLPQEDRAYRSKKELEESISVCLGGRVAEQMVLGDISTGASNDLERASHIAREMVTKYGMSERLGTVVYDTGHDEVFIGRSMAQARTYSEEVAGRIDEEIKAIIDNAYAQCEIILKNRMTELHRTAEYLLEHETMDAETFEKVFTDQWDGAPAPTQAQTAPDLPAPPDKEEHYDDRD